MKIYASISFDDGKKTHLTEYYPILKKFCFRGSFYPIVDQIGLSGRMNWKDLEFLYKEGNEIGSHTFSHRSLLDLNDSEIEVELKKSKEALKKFKTESLSYPFGNHNERVDQIASKYYLCARACGDIQGNEADYGINKRMFNKYSLKTLSLNDNIVSIYKKESFAWLIYVIHESPTVSLDYCLHSLKTRKVKVNDLFNFFKNLTVQSFNTKKSESDCLFKLCQALGQNKVKVMTISQTIKELEQYGKK